MVTRCEEEYSVSESIGVAIVNYTGLLLVGCYGTRTFSMNIKVWFNWLYYLRPRNRILCDIYMVVCSRISPLEFKEFSLSYSKLSENCTIAELTNNLEPIVYKYNRVFWRSR